MTTTFFVGPVGQDVGLTSLALGLARALSRSGASVAFLKPIAQDHSAADRSTVFARTFLQTVPDPLPRAHAEMLLGREDSDDLLEEIVALAEQARSGADIVVVEGLNLSGGNSYAGGLNALISRTLGAEAVLVASMRGLDTGMGAGALGDSLEITARDYDRSDGGGLAGLILNHVPLGTDFGAALAELRRHAPSLAGGKLPLLGVVGEQTELYAPRTGDVARTLGAVILNEGELSTRRVISTVVSARSAPYVADLLRPGALVVAPGDREDIVMAASLAHLSGVPLAGLLLTAGSAPDDSIARLCRSALSGSMPVLQVAANTYTTAGRLTQMERKIPLDDLERLERTLEFMADRLDIQPLKGLLSGSAPLRERRMTPPAFRHYLIEQSRAAAKRVVLPEGDEPRTIKAAVICHEKGIARCVLLAPPERVRAVAEAQGVTLPPELEILDPETVRGRYVAPMVEQRRSKGLTEPMAEAQLEDNVVLGTMMLSLGEVDGLVSGAVHTTASTVRPALQLIRTAPGAALVSSIFFMLMPEQVLVYGDAAINPNPNAQELADIAIQSADSAAAFGIEPRIAMLSYSTGTSGSGEDVEKVAEATRLVKERRPDLNVDGPLQYDAASVLSVGQQKAPGSSVAGRATVFIFPDLNTGNTTYKAVQRSAGVVAVGPMLQGLRKPVNDLSRGALVDDIVYTIALTAIQAAQVSKAGETAAEIPGGG
ncbi:phosphate acetyltransferase [Deinococcus detaillensis]|uniref:Phosphate acetyltransferase n=1 Tax=Deinococcus detaillensis TaxID=2592048 RepID=A0A553V2Q8_9DEIO|nr:phosphate acetyltransferase [Deinococcus detaillensis]TSA86720.1 phosphate acetyltransferase [Deinococcus detaillensis]